MKRLVAITELCVGCRFCEEKCSEAWNKDLDREKSCIRITNIGEKGYVVAVCSQCGSCIEYCPKMALYRDENGIVRLREDNCDGCLICVEHCPTGTLYHHPQLTVPFKCIACGLCVQECPSGAIEIEEIEAAEAAEEAAEA